MKAFALALIGLLSALTLGTAILARDDPRLDSGGLSLTDAVVVAVTGNAVELKVSDPARPAPCRVPESDFSGAAPAVGEVVPVTDSCELARVTGVLPRGSLTLTGLTGVAILALWAGLRWRRARRRRGQDQALATYLSRNVAR
ncbi:hypothetical protein [Symbioplanes lichenis]|uniref:hypothetical protein n=1 Tax=Symbioplanes lichenis TaxID=1629072 RepID=UPI00273A2284|nr:hypothetical protein [Actinoplanes lichenis]